MELMSMILEIPIASVSKLCNVCGYHNSVLSLKDREWICPDCKTPHDRDINAAINIKKFSILDQNLIITWHLRNAGKSLWTCSQKREGWS